MTEENKAEIAQFSDEDHLHGSDIVRCVAVACEGLTKHEMMDALASALSFPDYFGSNFDALFECLTERKEAVEVVMYFWSRANLTDTDRQSFENVFEDAVDEVGGEALRFEFVERVIE